MGKPSLVGLGRVSVPPWALWSCQITPLGLSKERGNHP
jgi:hypothetical protein